MFVFVQSDESPSGIISREDLWSSTVLDVSPDPPHLLELNSDLIEGLSDDGNKHILHQPSQEEDHGTGIYM